MKHNPYKILSELLSIGPHPNTDMLIIKPSLYAYLQNDKIQDVMKNGIPVSNGQLKVFFTRIPEHAEEYHDFVSQNSPIKIMISKLKRLKDQMIRIDPVGIDGYNKSLTEDDVKEICGNGKFFATKFLHGVDIDEIPHAIIATRGSVIPAFCLKAFTPEKRLIS
jgi:hypothetical protein